MLSFVFLMQNIFNRFGNGKSTVATHCQGVIHDILKKKQLIVSDIFLFIMGNNIFHYS